MALPMSPAGTSNVVRNMCAPWPGLGGGGAKPVHCSVVSSEGLHFNHPCAPPTGVFETLLYITHLSLWLGAHVI